MVSSVFVCGEHINSVHVAKFSKKLNLLMSTFTALYLSPSIYLKMSVPLLGEIEKGGKRHESHLKAVPILGAPELSGRKSDPH
ncbi:hypothetical protein D3C80_1531360 [compost metagenome]